MIKVNAFKTKINLFFSLVTPAPRRFARFVVVERLCAFSPPGWVAEGFLLSHCRRRLHLGGPHSRHYSKGFDCDARGEASDDATTKRKPIAVWLSRRQKPMPEGGQWRKKGWDRESRVTKNCQFIHFILNVCIF